MKKIIKFILRINVRTIYFNFKYFPLKQAIKFPVLLSRKVKLFRTLGTVEIKSEHIQTAMIKIGFGEVAIFDKKYSRSIWNVQGKVIFNGSAQIGHGSKIAVGENGILEFGENFQVSAESSIVAFHNVKFGNDCLLSWDVLIMDTDFHYITNSDNEIINSPKPIVIGNKVWIGCRSLVLKGSVIPDNCVIGANSIVNQTKPNQTKPNSLWVGNPAKEIKQNINWTDNI